MNLEQLANVLGNTTLCIGSCLKLFLIIPILLNNYSIQGIPILPIFTESLAWFIAIILNIRQGNPTSAWGEGLFIFSCNIWVLYLALCPLKRVWMLLLGLSVLYPILNALPEAMLGLTCAPIFLSGGLLLIMHHYRIKHIGRMSPWIFFLGCFCGWSRTLTAFIQIQDPIAHVSSVLGACISTILLFQVIYYRKGTLVYLSQQAKQD